MTHFAHEDQILLKDRIVISEAMSLGFADLGFATLRLLCRSVLGRAFSLEMILAERSCWK